MIYSSEIAPEATATNGRHQTEVGSASLIARIADHAMKVPGHPAIVDGATTVSFAQFDSRSNQLANYLTAIGAGAGSTVVLLFDRSADFVIAALAVMKAGGAYVPMDSSTPVDRAAMVVADSGAKAVLTHRQKARGLEGAGAHVVELDGLAAREIARQPTAAPSVEYCADDLAYVVYTSGSTGRPKGVEITHANLRCLIDWHQQAFGLTPADRASHVAGLGFDVVVWELWPNLTAGATLYIADEMTRRLPEDLQQWVLDEKITVCFAPTVLAEQLLQLDWPATASLRWMLTGGEALHRRPKLGVPFAFANCYGPAECAVVATSIRVSPGGNQTPTIGRAIPRTSTLILDENLRPVKTGEAGELCLAGDHVGPGYRNNPAMTARHYVMYTPPDGQAPMRIYRTGDRVRELENGEIDFLGRMDDQLKIRSHRVEPGEISAWLDKLPTVKKSAVVGRDCGNGLEIVAYFVAEPPHQPSLAELRSYLATKVPDYMIPTQFVPLPAFATTVNGKIDRKALPLPTPQNTLKNEAAEQLAEGNESSSDGVETEMENRLCAIIAALLGHASVKNTDNFFMIGGHSMLGIQLVAKIRDTFGVKLRLRQLFASPTVTALCAEIGRLQAAQANQPKS